MADDIFNEARAEHRAEQTRVMLRRFGPVGIAVVVIILAGVGIWQWRLHHVAEIRIAASARYFEAVHTLETASAAPSPTGLNDAQVKAEKVFADLADHAPADIRDFAGIRLAALRLAAHDQAGAVKAWQKIIDDKEAGPDVKVLARYLKLNASFGTEKPEVLHKAFEAMSHSAGPWHTLAQEGIVATDLRPDATDAQQEEARRLLTSLSREADAPDGLRQRASALLQTFPPEKTTAHAEPPSGTPRVQGAG